jgi:hypothetical protein
VIRPDGTTAWRASDLDEHWIDRRAIPRDGGQAKKEWRHEAQRANELISQQYEKLRLGQTEEANGLYDQAMRLGRFFHFSCTILLSP